MVRNSNRGAALGLALVALAISVSACAKKPLPITQAPPPPPPAVAPPPPAPAPAPPPVAQGPVPGSQQDFTINVGERVYFDLDQHDVRDDARPLLNAQAAWLNRYPSVQVRIEGNADERGTREYNLALGARRANAVRDHLVGAGVQAGRISTISFGKEQPVDGGASEEAYQRNRNARTALVSGTR